MACLLALVIASTVLTGGPAGKLTHAARTSSPAEAFWRTALPGAPIPEAIRELLRHGTNARNVDVRPEHHGGGPPPLPPMNFDYDYRRSSPRNEAAAIAAPSAEVLDRVVVAGGARPRNAAAPPPTVFFLEDAVRVGGVLPFPSIVIPRDTADDDAAAAAASPPPLRLYTVRAVRAVDGRGFVVCRRDREAGAGASAAGVMYGCRATGPAARAYVVAVVGERGETATAAVVCRADDVPRALWPLDEKPGGAAVCHAALDAQVIPVKNGRCSAASSLSLV